MRPVRPELKFHRNPGNDADHEVYSQNARPAPSSLMVGFVVAPQCNGFQNNKEGRQPHGELWEEVVEGNRKGKMQTVNQECAIHVPISLSPRKGALCRGGFASD